MSLSILIASWGGAGHLGPTLTAANQLTRRGHRVRFIARPDARTDVEAAGYGFVTWETPYTVDSPIGGDGDDMGYAYDHLLFGPAAARAADTRHEIDRVPTDVLLCDAALFGAMVAGEAAPIPCLAISCSINLRPLPGVPPIGSHLPIPRTAEDRATVDAANQKVTDHMNRWLPMLNDARASQGLGPVDHVLEMFDRLDRVLIAISAAFDAPAAYLPMNTRYIGPLLDEARWSKPFESPWGTASGRARVLASFSTTQQNQADALQRVVNAISAAGMDGIATTGPALDDVTLHAAPNVTLLPSAPHDQVMQEATVVVAHGGHGTVSRALRHGLPILVMPMGRDQNDIAMRVEGHGAGIVLPPDASEAKIARALERLVGEPGFSIAAKRLGAAIEWEIEAQMVVHEVEAMARVGGVTA